jgi:hypothetical protein
MERKYKGQFNSVEKSVIEIVAWLGALVLIIAPFFRDIATTSLHMIFGLSLLTIQAIDETLFNLIILNICGIIGWSLKLKKEREIEKARLG